MLDTDTIQITPELLALIAEIQGCVAFDDVFRLTGASRNTLKEHFRRLLAQGHLVRRGRGKGTWHGLP